jgi:Diacylglycerol acyltransferase
MCNFASDSTGFQRGFPGVRPHLLTLTSNFTIPIYRDILLLLGVCSVSKRSCERILRQGNGSAITIVVGGAAESLSAHPGTADLTLRRRCVDLFDDGGRLVTVLLDWDSSNLRFGKGMVSCLIVVLLYVLMLRCPARTLYRCFRSARMTCTLPPSSCLPYPYA